MTLIFTENMKCYWKKFTSFLCNICIKFFKCLASICTSQLTMVFNLFRINIFFTKSTNITISIMVFISFCHCRIFLSVPKEHIYFIFKFFISSTNQSTLSCPKENYIIHFVKHCSIQTLYINHYKQRFVYKK